MKLVAYILALLFLGTAIAQQQPLPKTARDFVESGMDRFRAGRIKESVADFEEAARLKPELKAQLWQLGISYYYAGEFEKGRQLFELHRTVNPEDVENAAWHFLCVAKLKGIDAARKTLIPVADDRRRPMKEIYDFYGGKVEKAAVLTAARSDEELFYAHLYLGLFEEAAGNPEKSLAEMKVAERFAPKHYMGDVARVHLKLRGKIHPNLQELK